MYKKLQAIKLSDAEKPFLKPDNIANQQNDFKGDVNKILEEEKEKELFDDKRLNPQEDGQNKKTKRALPKKKKTDRDYEKIEQKEQ
jgi:hypothetical protein